MSYIIRRLLWLPVIMWAVASLTFLVLRLVPGDPFASVSNQAMDASQLERTRAVWGLDQPIWRQYLSFTANLVRGDLGDSMSSGVPLTRLLFEKLPPTIELALAALVVSTILGVGAGLALTVAAAIFIASLLGIFDRSQSNLKAISLTSVWLAVALAGAMLLKFPLERAFPLVPQPGCNKVAGIAVLQSQHDASPRSHHVVLHHAA